MKFKKRIIIISIIFLFIIIISFIFLHGSYNTINRQESNGVRWNGKQDIATYGSYSDISSIALPGFSSLRFVADQKTQEVNLYNPDVNTCIMEMRLELSDGTLLWHSGNIHPGYGFYEIKLLKTLGNGVYNNCRFVIKCFDEQGVELNGGVIQFTLYVY
jgi:hypothetical protein